MAEIAGGPAEAYIDLARLGRNDWWSITKAILRILLYSVLFVVVALIAEGAILAYAPDTAQRLGDFLQTPIGQLMLVLVVYLILLWSIRDAVVKSQRRPFLSLFGPDLRLDWRRCAIGGGIWLAAMMVGLLVQASVDPLLEASDDGAMIGGFDWSLLPVAAVGLVVIPIQAGTEELLCRGWLTQLLGQAIRRRLVVALVVAAVFSALHGPGSAVAFAYYVIVALGLSALSLHDGRLELAIGAHTAQNLFVLLVVSPLASVTHTPSLLSGNASEMSWIELPVAAVIGGFAYVFAAWLLPRLRPAAVSASR